MKQRHRGTWISISPLVYRNIFWTTTIELLSKNTIASLDQLKPIRIEEDLVVNIGLMAYVRTNIIACHVINLNQSESEKI